MQLATVLFIILKQKIVETKNLDTRFYLTRDNIKPTVLTPHSFCISHCQVLYTVS